MIKLYSLINEWQVFNLEINNYPDNTLRLKVPDNLPESLAISWNYENDSELFTIKCLVDNLRQQGVRKINLYMPYIPHARMDRIKSRSEVFTLKSFADVINSMNFDTVIVLDPHSNVSTALINNIYVKPIGKYINKAVEMINENLDDKKLLVVFPDEGANKRYSSLVNCQTAFGIKRRNWNTGKIESLDLIGMPDNKDSNYDVLIIDDICSYGGTFYHTLLKLREYNYIWDINLYITHCESNIFKGDLYQKTNICNIFTTDSIMSDSIKESLDIKNKLTIFKISDDE